MWGHFRVVICQSYNIVIHWSKRLIFCFWYYNMLWMVNVVQPQPRRWAFQFRPSYIWGKEAQAPKPIWKSMSSAMMVFTCATTVDKWSISRHWTIVPPLPPHTSYFEPPGPISSDSIGTVGFSKLWLQLRGKMGQKISKQIAVVGALDPISRSWIKISYHTSAGTKV